MAVALLSCRRTFDPGSQWLYCKLYTGTATADQVLTGVVAPVVRQPLSSGAADQWFFIRYADPKWHLRIRFHGEPRRLLGEVLPLLRQAIAPLIDDGLIWSMALDTYRREVERYGGAAGIELAEQLFEVDSEAVLRLLDLLEGDAGAAVRWRLALRGSLLLLLDLGLEEAENLQVLQRMAQSFASEFNVRQPFKKQLSDRLRAGRRELEELLEPGWRQDHPLAPAIAVLDERSRQLQPIIGGLRQRQQASRLTAPLSTLAASYIHMFNNRLLRSQARAHELVLYDFLSQLTRSMVARRRTAG